MQFQRGTVTHQTRRDMYVREQQMQRTRIAVSRAYTSTKAQPSPLIQSMLTTVSIYFLQIFKHTHYRWPTEV